MSNPTEVVQGLYAAYRRGDLPAILASLTSDVVWESEGPASVAFCGIRRGIKETTGFFEALNADFANPELTLSEIVASGDAVMTLGRYKATARKTGKVFDTPIAHYWRIRDGKVARYVGFDDTAAAVEALRS
jgi:ketosteroid isomerase-like protein